MHGTPAQHIRLLTPECVSVVDNANLSLRLYRFDPRAPVPCALATADGCECVLKLPALAPNVAYAEMDSVIGHPPDYPPHTRPLFVHDPSLSPLVLDVTMSVGMPPRSNHPAERYGRTLEERFLLFVPPETIRTFGCPDEFERGSSHYLELCVVADLEHHVEQAASYHGRTGVQSALGWCASPRHRRHRRPWAPKSWCAERRPRAIGQR